MFELSDDEARTLFKVQRGAIEMRSAARSDSLLKLVALLKAGVPANAFDAGTFETALHLTSTLPLVDALIEHGADVNYEDRRGRTPLYCALEARKVDTFKRLLAVG